MVSLKLSAVVKVGVRAAGLDHSWPEMSPRHATVALSVRAASSLVVQGRSVVQTLVSS